MKICVFTCNQPRHLSLLEKLSKVADKVYAIQESKTVFPGKVKDFYNNSSIMNNYFEYVNDAEQQLFGEIDFLPSNVYQLVIKNGDASYLSLKQLKKILDADIYITFGASYLKGEIADFLIERRAINIHMGISPYYRGTSCNFWALYDNHPELVGATIHLLGRGLDSGDILYHALPKAERIDPFLLGMKAVEVAQKSLTSRILDKSILSFTEEKQDTSKQYRYTKNIEFTDEVAADYIKNMPDAEYVYSSLKNRDEGMFIRPFIG